jgi:hypothetical protein
VQSQRTGGLSPTAVAELQQLVPRIREGLKRTATDMAGVGADLIRAKALVPHGDWMGWLAQQFGLSASAAENFMRVARLSERLGGQFAALANLPAAALYELSARSTPPELLEAILAGKVPPTLEGIRSAKAKTPGNTEASAEARAARLARAIEAAWPVTAEEIASALWSTELEAGDIGAFAGVLEEAADLLQLWELQLEDEQETGSERGMQPARPAAASIFELFEAIGRHRDARQGPQQGRDR